MSDHVRVTYKGEEIFRGKKVDAILFLFDNGYIETQRVHPQLRRKYGDQRSRQAVQYKAGIKIEDFL